MKRNENDQEGVMDVVIYIHGAGGSAGEAEHYRALFPECEVIELDYRGSTPWEAGPEIREAVAGLKDDYGRVILIANSIGAFFSMNAGIEAYIAGAYFISPIVDMEGLIGGMMERAGVTERELEERKVIPTDFGEDLSWECLCYVREHPVSWSAPAEILYGSEDFMTSFEAESAFAERNHAGLTVMDGGEHWFHTEEQMEFLDEWIRGRMNAAI